MSGTLKLAPVAVLQIGTVIDDGSPVTGEGPPVQVQVPLATLAGCAFYAELLAKLPEFQADYDASVAPADRAPVGMEADPAD